MFNNSLLISNRYPLRLYTDPPYTEIPNIKISDRLQKFCLVLNPLRAGFQGQRANTNFHPPGESILLLNRGSDALTPVSGKAAL